MSVTKLFFVDDESLLLVDSLEVFFEPLEEFSVVERPRAGRKPLRC
jgi:hypothetical protein